MSREIPNSHKITAYIHCSLCLQELPEGIAPREWKDLEVGWTELGLQVWCVRHEVNVLHIDFEGITHPANVSRQKIDGEDEDEADSFLAGFDEA